MAGTSYDDAYDELIAAVGSLGFPPELACALRAQLKGEGSMRRMAAYLRGARPRSIEEIADEAVAISDLRDSWIDRKISEHANARMTEFYNRPREGQP